MILSCMHVICRQAHLVKKGIIILIFFACALNHYRETDRLVCDIEISGKTKQFISTTVDNKKNLQEYNYKYINKQYIQ